MGGETPSNSQAAGGVSRSAERPFRILCVLSELLGNAAYTSKLKDALGRIQRVELTYVCVGPADYTAYPVPRWRTLSDPLHVQSVVRKKLHREARGDFDALFVNGWDLGVGLGKLVRVLPTAVAMDVVPSLAGKLLLRERPSGPLRRLRRWAADGIHHRAFARLAPHVELFLPFSSWCAEALQEDYRVPADRLRITLVPQDLDQWRPASPTQREGFQILFVANDFKRKGGDLLLKIFESALPRTCTLVIASHDASLERRSLPAGVQWVKGLNRQEMLEIYRRSDILVLPSRRDMLPQVLAEAMAVGLPCIAADVGGVSDLVRDGRTGHLMPYDAGADEWAERIRWVLENEEERLRLSVNARAFAEEHLGLPRFRTVIAEVVERLRGACGPEVTSAAEPR